VRQASWRGPTGERPARVGRSGRPVVSVAVSSATAAAKRTQRLSGVGYWAAKDRSSQRPSR